MKCILRLFDYIVRHSAVMASIVISTVTLWKFEPENVAWYLLAGILAGACCIACYARVLMNKDDEIQSLKTQVENLADPELRRIESELKGTGVISKVT